MKMNMNDQVRVKLTPYGMNCLRSHLIEYNNFREQFAAAPLPFTLPTTDAEGYMTWSLWELMNIFGKYHSVGHPVIFEDNSVLVCET